MKTVTKGTNRPAAAARSSRHAQRTILPPKASQRENFELAMKMEKAVPQYDRMTQPQLLVAARKLGLEPSKSMPKGKLLEVIMSQVRSAEAIERGNKAGDQPEPKANPESAPAPWQAEAARSANKAAGLIADLEPSGWTARRLENDTSAYAIVLERGIEAIHIAWIDGVFQYQSATYTCGERTIKIRNASQARQIGARGADAAAVEVTKVVGNKAFKKRAPAGPRRPERLPFDPKMSLDEDVISALLGRKVVWVNRVSGNDEEATVTPLRKHVQVIDTDSGRVLKFIDHALGFKAFRLEDVRKVGAGVLTEAPPKTRPKAKRAKAAAAEEE